jgi:hypothetical protein
MDFIKKIYESKPFTTERYEYYEMFKNKVHNKLFESKDECINLANNISPGLGFTTSVETIIKSIGINK